MAKITVDENICKGCGLCVNVCPRQVISLAKDRLNAKGYTPAQADDMSRCIGCAMCGIMCPDSAITVER